jgi:hypothetical protein
VLLLVCSLLAGNFLDESFNPGTPLVLDNHAKLVVALCKETLGDFDAVSPNETPLPLPSVPIVAR